MCVSLIVPETSWLSTGLKLVVPYISIHNCKTNGAKQMFIPVLNIVLDFIYILSEVP